MANDTKLVNLADLKEAFDTLKTNASQSAAGLMSSTDKAKLDGIAAGAQVNTITGVKGSEEASYRTGNVSISAENVGALVSDFSELDHVGTFSGNERIPLYLNGENYSTDMQTLLYSAGGGGSNQGAVTDYKKVCGPISSLPWTSAADSNITADMYLSYATSSKPSVLSVFDWSTSNNGTVTISAKNSGGAVTLSESVTLTLYFSVGMSTAPSILTNLGSNTEDNILKAAPRPGVYGTLGIANGGTNASSASAARTNLDVYSKNEVNNAIQQSAATISVTFTGSSNISTNATTCSKSANIGIASINVTMADIDTQSSWCSIGTISIHPSQYVYGVVTDDSGARSCRILKTGEIYIWRPVARVQYIGSILFTI